MLAFARFVRGALQRALILLVPALGWAEGDYQTNFSVAESPTSEHGRWINGKAVGADWQDVRTVGGLACGTQSGISGVYDNTTAVLAGTWDQDQSVQARVHSVNQNSKVWEEVELRLRTVISPHSLAGYEINFRCLKKKDAYMEIVRWNGPPGSFTRLGHFDGAEYGVADGDTVKATIVGNTTTVYKNGVEMGDASDRNAFTNGGPGIGFWLYGTARTKDYGFTSFSATDRVAQ